MLVIISLSACAANIMEYEFKDEQPSASQIFGGTFIDEGTVTVTIQKIAVSSKTKVYFTVKNDTTETASFFMTEPTLIVDGNQINTTTFAIGSDVVPSASRSFIYSFDIKLEKDTVFDLTMSIFVAKGGLSQIITVEGIDLSKADYLKSTGNAKSQNPQGTVSRDLASQTLENQFFSEMLQGPPTGFFGIFDFFNQTIFAVIMIMLIINTTISIIVYFDAKKTGITPAIAWAFLSWITNYIGLVVYLMVRYDTKRKYAFRSDKSQG